MYVFTQMLLNVFTYYQSTFILIIILSCRHVANLFIIYYYYFYTHFIYCNLLYN